MSQQDKLESIQRQLSLESPESQGQTNPSSQDHSPNATTTIPRRIIINPPGEGTVMMEGSDSPCTSHLERQFQELHLNQSSINQYISTPIPQQQFTIQTSPQTYNLLRQQNVQRQQNMQTGYSSNIASNIATSIQTSSQFNQPFLNYQTQPYQSQPNVPSYYCAGIQTSHPYSNYGVQYYPPPPPIIQPSLPIYNAPPIYCQAPNVQTPNIYYQPAYTSPYYPPPPHQQRGQQESAEEAMERKIAVQAKTRQALISTAPKYDGSTDIELWWSQMNEYLADCQINDDAKQLQIVRWCCKGKVQEFLGTVIPIPRSMSEMKSTLVSRYGEDYTIRLRRYNELKQEASENLRDYSDRVQRLSYGLNKPLPELIMKFLLTVRNSSQVYPILINHKFSSLREVTEAVERMQDKVEQPVFTIQTKKCTVCGKIGHLARDCRSKISYNQRPANNRTAKVKAAEIEDIPIDDMEDSFDQEEDDYEINASIFQTATSGDPSPREVMPAEKRAAEREQDSQHGEILKKIRVQGYTPQSQTTYQQGKTTYQQGNSSRQTTTRFSGAAPRKDSLSSALKGKVDVSADLLLGMIAALAGEKITTNLATKAKKQAQQALQDSAQIEQVDISQAIHAPAEAKLPFNPLSIDYAGSGKGEPLYLPVWVEGSDQVQFFLIDTGAMVSLITTGVVNFLNLAKAGHTNVKRAGFKVNGVTQGDANAAILETPLTLGFRKSLRIDSHLTIIDSPKYKLILGMDILGPMDAQIGVKDQLMQLTYENEVKRFRLLTREEVKRQRSLKEYSQHADTNVFTADVPSAEVNQLNLALQDAREERSLNFVDDRCLVYLDQTQGDQLKEVLTTSAILALNAAQTPSSPVSKASSFTSTDDEQGDLQTTYVLPVNYCGETARPLPYLRARDISSLQFKNGMEVNQMLPRPHKIGDMGTAELAKRRSCPELPPGEVSQLLRDLKITDEGEPNSLPRRAYKLKQALEAHKDIVNPLLDTFQKKQALQMLLKHAEIFATEIEDLHVPAKVQPMVIDTRGHPPIKIKPYKISHDEVEFLKTTIESQKQAGVVAPSSSPWSFPCFVTYRKTLGLNKIKPRKVVNYQKLNDVTIADSYPLPNAETLLDELHGAQYFGCLDLKSGFWQVELASEEDRQKTAFSAYMLGLHHYNRVPFGFRNAPSHFMRVIDQMLTEDELRQNSFAFVDDLCTHSDQWLSYLQAQDQLLQGLLKRHWLVTPDKVFIGYTQASLLGHIITQGTVKPQPEKLQAIKQLNPPSTVKELQAFLGVVGYYRRFIPHFSRMAAPLHKLTAKDTTWTWGEAQQEAWEALRDSLTESSFLHLPQPSGKFKIYTDYSSTAISAVLHQQQDDHGEVPICFAGRICRGREKHLSSAEGELLACIYALQKYRHYLGFAEFDLVTDSRALTALRTTNNLAGKLARWAMFLSEFRINLIHKAGKTHCNADGLSRCITEDDGSPPIAQIWNLSARDDFLEDESYSIAPKGDAQLEKHSIYTTTLSGYQQDTPQCTGCNVPLSNNRINCDYCGDAYHRNCCSPAYQAGYWYCDGCQGLLDENDPATNLKLLKYAATGSIPSTIQLPQDWKEYSFNRGLLFRTTLDGKFIVPSPYQRLLLLEDKHEELAHPGAGRMASILERVYWWPGMHSQIKNFAQSCLDCQLQNAIFHRKDTLGGHLSASTPRSSWSIDCAPSINAKDGGRWSIIVAVDDCSKLVTMGVIENLNSEAVARWVTERILGPYGKPDMIRTDHGREFQGRFTQLLRSLGVEHRLTRTHAPWTNGRAERTVRTIKSMIKRCISNAPSLDWRDLIPFVNNAINSSISRATGFSPYEIFYGENITPLLTGLPDKATPMQLGELDPVQLEKYVKVLKKRLAQVRQAASKQEEAYRQQLETGYTKQTVRDGRITKQHKHYYPGQLILVRTGAITRGHWTTQAAGPYLVIEVQPQSLKVQNIASGRISLQNKANCIPLKTQTPLQLASEADQNLLGSQPEAALTDVE